MLKEKLVIFFQKQKKKIQSSVGKMKKLENYPLRLEIKKNKKKVKKSGMR